MAGIKSRKLDLINKYEQIVRESNYCMDHINKIVMEAKNAIATINDCKDSKAFREKYIEILAILDQNLRTLVNINLTFDTNDEYSESLLNKENELSSPVEDLEKNPNNTIELKIVPFVSHNYSHTSDSLDSVPVVKNINDSSNDIVESRVESYTESQQNISKSDTIIQDSSIVIGGEIKNSEKDNTEVKEKIIQNYIREHDEYLARIALLNKSGQRFSTTQVNGQIIGIQLGPPGFSQKPRSEKSGESSNIRFTTFEEQANNKNNISASSLTEKIISENNYDKSSVKLLYSSGNKYTQPEDLDIDSSSSNASGKNDELINEFEINPVDHIVKINSSKLNDLLESNDVITKNKLPELISDAANNQCISTTETGNLSNIINDEMKLIDRSENDNEVSDLPSSELPPLDSLCIITYFETPSHFYIMPANKITENYDVLHEQICQHCTNAYCRNYSTKLEMIKSNKGHFFACYLNLDSSTDYPWHRCEIIDYLLDSDDDETKVKVQLVDEGIKGVLDISDLRDLPPEAFKYPRMVHKCSLAYIYPPGSTASNILKEWPQETNDICKEFFKMAESFKISFCELIDNCLHVILVNEFDSQIIAPLIARNAAVIIMPEETDMLGLNIFLKSELIKNQISLAKGINQVDDDQSDAELELNLQEQISEAIEGGYTPKDYARICKFTDETGTKCFKGSNCHLEHGFLNPDGWTTDKQYIYSRIDEFSVHKGSKMPILVTHIVDGTHFYAQIQYNKNITVTAKQLTKSINDPERIKNYKKLKFLPAFGELVLALYDGFWYRARVIDSYENKHEVFFIDYGNKSMVLMSELREIPSEFVSKPEQAILFQIVNIETDDKTEINAEKYLQSNVLDMDILAVVCEEIDCLVKAHIFNKKGEDIGDLMVYFNIANPVQKTRN